MPTRHFSPGARAAALSSGVLRVQPARLFARIFGHSLVRLGAAFLLGTAGVAALAQPALKPGLWEMQMKNAEIEAAMKQLQQEMAAMPPDQRAQMEKMMGQKGAAMAPGGLVRVCHTADSLKQRGPVNEEPGCSTKTQWSGNGGSFEMSCKDGRKGKGEFAMVGSDAYKGFFEMTDPKMAGKPFRMEQSGRWISPDCGALKPAGTPSAQPGKG